MPITPLTEAETIQAVRSQVGFLGHPNLAMVTVLGPDAPGFLHALTTNEVKDLAVGQGNMQAALDRKALIQAYFSLHRVDTGFWLLMEPVQVEALLAYLEQRHFSEDVTYVDQSATLRCLSLHGPKGQAVLETVFSQDWQVMREFDIRQVSWQGDTVQVIRRSMTGDEGYLLLVPNTLSDALQQAVLAAGESEQMVMMTPEILDVMRIEAGLPVFGVDMDHQTQLTDTGLERLAVSYSKGCFPGQEIVAKVKTYGSSPRSLVGLVFESLTTAPPLDTPCRVEGREIGTIKSGAHSPMLNQVIALAYLHRDFRVPDKLLNLEIDGRTVPVKVILLPFYKPLDAHEKASRKYDAALQLYAQDKNPEAIALLREAVELDPHYTTAYEALGVILSKQGELDEAIRLMQKLAELDPDEVMAHTNLSVFYMQKGWKDEAEQEKAIATTLAFKKQIASVQQQKQQATQKEQQRQALEEKRLMFAEVLELDPDDGLANYGMGNTLVELERYSEAIPYLQTAIAGQPKYTVAYLALGRAFQGANQPEQARTTYEKGIEVAAQKGDLMPLKDMQQRLAGCS